MAKSKDSEYTNHIYAVLTHYTEERFGEVDAEIGVLYSKLLPETKEYIAKAELEEILHGKLFSATRAKLRSSANMADGELTVTELRDLSKNISDYLANIPFKYKVYLPIPMSEAACVFRHEGIEIKENKTMDISPIDSEASRQCICFRELGYVGDSDENKLYLTIVSDVKQFLYLACMGGAANRYGDCKVNSVNEFKFRIAIADETNKTLVRRLCPESISRLLKQIKFKSEKRRLKNVLSPAANFIYSVDPNTNPIKFAIEWAFDAMVSEDETTGFINRCVAIEAILGEGKSDDVGLTATLSDRCAYLLGKSFSKRKHYREKFKKMYVLRSKIVHGRKKLEKADEEQIEFQKEILDSIIFQELENLGYLKPGV